MTNKRMVEICALLVLAGTLVYLVFFGDTVFAQMRRAASARGHFPLVVKAIARDPGFAHVKAAVGSGEAGCIFVNGYVASQRDLDRLEQCVASTKPPVTISFAVTVNPEAPEAGKASEK